jgi:hypothetical protein
MQENGKLNYEKNGPHHMTNIRSAVSGQQIQSATQANHGRYQTMTHELRTGCDSNQDKDPNR